MSDYHTLDLMGGFNKDTIPKFYDRVLKAPSLPLIIYMMGSGGMTGPQQGLIDIILSYDVPVTVISVGTCSSACATFPHSGTFIRLCYPKTSFTYHARNNMLEGDAVDLINRVGYFREQVERDIEEFSIQIGLDLKEAQCFHRDEYPIFPEQALMVGEHGLIDGIILKDHRDGTYLIKTRDGNKVIDIKIHRRHDIKNLPIHE